MPPFVDLFAGTATVAASMIERKSKASRERSSQIVNDADPLMICFAWAFTYHQKELRSRLAKFQNRIMKEDFNFNNSSYTESEYENHYGFMDSLMRLKSDEYWEDKSKKYWEKELLTNPKIWDNFVIQLRYSKSYIAKAKKKAQRYKEFIIRIRSWYEDDERYWKSLDRDALRKINFNELPKDKINNQVDDILDYALAVFYYYSFKPRGKNLFFVTNVDERNYYSFLDRLNVGLKDVQGKDRADMAWSLTKLRLHPASLKLEYSGHFSRNLRGATFTSEDFRSLLQNGLSDRIYYLDPPYFLTTGYAVKFSDKDHKDMLDRLRNADFKWIFSMQYHQSIDANKKSRRGQSPIISDYWTYYRGFYSPLQLGADQRVYIPADTSKQVPANLFVILFDVDAARKKRQKIYWNTIEMLVVNFECLRTIPLHDTAVVLPFDLFLQCADDGKSYKEIVQRAIAWRENNITSNYAGGSAV